MIVEFENAAKENPAKEKICMFANCVKS